MQIKISKAESTSISSKIAATSIASVFTFGLLAGVFGASALFFILSRDLTTRATNLSSEIPRLALTSLVDGDYQPVASKLEVFRSSQAFSYVSISDSRGGPVAAFGEKTNALFEYCSENHPINDANGISWGFYQHCYNRWSALKYAIFTGLSFFVLMLVFALLLANRLSKKIFSQSSNFNQFLQRLKTRTDRLLAGNRGSFESKSIGSNLIEERQIDEIVSGLIDELSLQFRRHELMSRSLVEAQTRNTISRRVAHDIKSPLSAIKIVSDYLPEGSQERSLAKQAIQRIEGVLGELSRSRKSEKALVTWIDVLNLIETIFAEKQTQHPDAQMRIQVDPSLCDELFLQGDITGLGRLFSNIIQNSIEAMSDRSLILLVRVDKLTSGLRVQFQDNGCGFSESLIKGFGLGELTTKSTGQGIGLSSATEYLKAISGKLEIRNWQEGAEVVVQLAEAPKGQDL